MLTVLCLPQTFSEIHCVSYHQREKKEETFSFSLSERLGLSWFLIQLVQVYISSSFGRNLRVNDAHSIE